MKFQEIKKKNYSNFTLDYYTKETYVIALVLSVKSDDAISLHFIQRNLGKS